MRGRQKFQQPFLYMFDLLGLTRTFKDVGTLCPMMIVAYLSWYQSANCGTGIGMSEKS